MMQTDIDNQIMADYQKQMERIIDSMRATLRDRFAMAALQGFLSAGELNQEMTETHEKNAPTFARICYVLADAMMEAREK
jgi:hypothetical protein